MKALLDDIKTYLENQAEKVSKDLDEFPNKTSLERPFLQIQISTTLDKMRSQLEIYQVNLSLIKSEESEPYKKFYKEFTKRYYTIVGRYKSLCSSEEPHISVDQNAETLPTDRIDFVPNTLFGRAEEREQKVSARESKLNILPCIFQYVSKIAHMVIEIGNQYQKKTEEAVIRTGRQVKQTINLAEEIIVFFNRLRK